MEDMRMQSNSWTQTNAQTHLENCLRVIGASCFWSSNGRYPRPLWFDILTAVVCACVCDHCEASHLIKHIPCSGLSLYSSKWNNSLFLDFVCLSSQVWVFQSFAITVETEETDNWFHQQQGSGPLQTQNERLEGTLPEWVHFLHNPPQSSPVITRLKKSLCDTLQITLQCFHYMLTLSDLSSALHKAPAGCGGTNERTARRWNEEKVNPVLNLNTTTHLKKRMSHF